MIRRKNDGDSGASALPKMQFGGRERRSFEGTETLQSTTKTKSNCIGKESILEITPPMERENGFEVEK